MCPAPPPPDPSGEIAALQADLEDYRVDRLEALLSPVARAALDRDQLVPALAELRRVADAGGADRRLALLTLLFALGEPLTTAELDEALPTVGHSGALEANLVVPVEGTGRVRAAVDLSPVDLPEQVRWLASDLHQRVNGRALPPWHVLGVGGASLALASLLPEGEVSRVLDLGTGCGVQALTLAGRARHIVATDISERALAFAAFNDALNRGGPREDSVATSVGSPTIELRRGSLLEPVAGETFDLVVSNPPFVITPRAAYAAGLPVMTYRDAGTQATGDAVMRGLLTDLGAHLTPGGRAVIIGNWEVCDEDPYGALTRVLEEAERHGGVTLDSWVVRRDAQDPAEYAEMWLADGGADLDAEMSHQIYRAYLKDFAARGVREVAFGYILLTRSAHESRPSLHCADTYTHARAPLGPTLWRLFDVRRMLSERSDADVAGACIRAEHDVTMEHHFRIGESAPEAITLTQGGGLGLTIRAGTELAGLISAADGSLTVEQIAGALAALLDTDGEEMRAACIAHARRLASDGFVTLECAR
ncbi:MAG: class I SAM-dependent methyltransferase [Bowdeniella nasicola]|nr:class I SAM-dependent methyltransferase [Bowdeniella nasicola]